ncbi:glycoside hydrolase family 71 protein [Bradyrhizobium sp. 169]|uniref:glycoside hydrolase family 71 protein n=1 Tax=unclassified Bradyrhizobium TaxID=2631580 RepID=UPI001FFAE464|nr:hypothetical protein [Bradyrhizobium sp. CW11]MCK1587115.1 hypothetical protein [Bradyrhizobium sp. 169]
MSIVAAASDDTVRPIVFAHYMHSYILGAYPASDDRVRNPQSTYRLERWFPLNFESSWYSQDLAMIASDGEKAVVKEFELMSGAGLNAIGLLLGPRMLPESQFSRGLGLVATVAAQATTKIIPELWADPWTEDFKAFGQNVKRFMDAHPGAFLSRQGKPMFIFAFDSKIAEKAHDPASAPINQIAAFLEPWGGLGSSYVVIYVPYEQKKALRSPLVLKANAVDVWAPQDDWSALHSSVVFQVATALRKEVVFPVSPAFYQRRAGQFPMEYGNSFGAARYIDGWLQAIKMKPALVNIQTWNDFSEDTAIVPSNTVGYAWLDLTAYFSAWFRTGTQPEINVERLMLFRPKQLASARLDNPAAKATNALWRHASPTIDYLDVVTFFRYPAKVRVTLGGQTWERAIPAGLHDWVIYSRANNDSSSRLQARIPFESPLRLVTSVNSFEPATPVVQVFREGEMVGRLVSKMPLLDHGPWQDLAVIADEAKL